MEETKDKVKMSWEEYFYLISSLPPKLTNKEGDKQFKEYCKQKWPKKKIYIGGLLFPEEIV